MYRFSHRVTCALILSALGCSRVEDAADRFKLESLDGSAIDLHQHKGSVVFVNLWATWCGPCLKEMPTIARAMDLLADEPIVFYLASDEEAGEIRDFAASRNMKLPLARIDNGVDLGVQALPATFIIGKDGALAHTEYGYREWDSSESMELLMTIIGK